MDQINQRIVSSVLFLMLPLHHTRTSPAAGFEPAPFFLMKKLEVTLDFATDLLIKRDLNPNPPVLVVYRFVILSPAKDGISQYCQVEHQYALFSWHF